MGEGTKGHPTKLTTPIHPGQAWFHSTRSVQVTTGLDSLITTPGTNKPGERSGQVTQATVGIKLSVLLKEYLVCDAISSCDQMFHFIHRLKFIF